MIVPSALVRTVRTSVVIGVVAALLVGCTGHSSDRATSAPSPTEPSVTGAPPPSSAAPVRRHIDPPCPDFIIVPCLRQAATVAVPVSGTDLALVWASDRPELETQVGGLPWTLDVLHRYDPAEGRLVLGTGTVRHVAGVAVGAELAVPALDASQLYVFDKSGRHLRTLDLLTGVVVQRFDWDGGLLAAVVEPGGTTRFHRDSSGAVTALVTSDGYRTVLDVVGGALIAVRDSVGGITSIGYDTSGLVVAVTDPSGAQTALSYGGDGTLASIRSPEGGTTKYSRTESGEGFTLTTASPAGRVTRQQVRTDGGRQIRTVTDPSGATTTSVSEGSHREVTYPDGTSVRFDLADDPRWGLAAPLVSGRVERPGGARSDFAQERRYPSTQPTTADSDAELTWISGAGTWRLRHTAEDRTTTVTDPAGLVESVVYGADGLLASGSRGGVPLRYTWSDGTLTAVTVGSGAQQRSWTHSTDPKARTITSIDPLGRTTVERYDGLGKDVAVTAPDGATATITRDSNSNVIAVSSAGRDSTQLIRTPDARLAAVIPPGGNGQLEFTGYSYDADGLLSTTADAGGGTVEIERDAGGRVSAIHSGEQLWRLDYDQAGRLASIAGLGTELARTFTGGLLTAERWTGPTTMAVDRTLDAVGRITEVGTAVGKVAYRYDEGGRLVQAGDLTVQYDASGRVSREQLGSLTRSYGRNAFGELESVRVEAAGAPVWEMTLTRDTLGRITTQRTTAGGNASTRAFTYDKAGRLATVDQDGAVTEYSYDLAGNLTSQSSAGNTVRTTYNGRDQVITSGKAGYTYDGSGRLIAAGAARYSYDSLGHLIEATTAGGKHVTYQVDGFGRRVGKAVDGKQVQGLAYVGDLPVAEFDGSGVQVSQFVYALAEVPAYVVKGGRQLLLLTDQVGTPQALVDAGSGAVTEVGDTDVWGRKGRQAVSLPIGFAGGLADGDTGLVHFGAREYDPATTRWTSRDPELADGGDPNLYRYVDADPVNRVDRQGRDGEDAVNVACKGHFCVDYRGVPKVRTDTGPSKPQDPLDGLKDDVIPDPSVTVCVGPACAKVSKDGAEAAPGGASGVSLGLPVPADFVRRQYERSAERARQAAEQLELPDSGGKGSTDPCATSPGLCAPAKSTGDPHLTTADGLPYDLQAVGEFTLLASDSGDLRIQSRQEPIPRTPLTWNTAVAMNVAGDRIGFYGNYEEGKEHQLLVRINGKPALDAVGSSGASIDPTMADIALPHGGLVRSGRGVFYVVWPDGTTVGVTSLIRYGVHLTVSLAESRKGTVTGLLGPFTGERADYVQRADGSKVPGSKLQGSDIVQRELGDSWRITQAESLFEYDKGKSTASYTDRGFPANAPKIEVPAAVSSAAEVVCRRAGIREADLPGCIIDVAATGDAGFAAALHGVYASIAGAAALAASTATAGSGTEQPAGSAGSIVPGQTVRGTVAGGSTVQYAITIAEPTVGFFAGADNCGDSNTSWIVYDSANQNLTSSEPICNDLGRVVFPAAGTYRLEISNRPGGQASSYELSWLPSRTDRLLALRAGQATNGTIDMPGAQDVYTIDAPAGSVVFVATDSECIGGDMQWSLLEPNDGKTLRNEPICINLGRHELTTGGTYRIQVRGGRATGDYRIAWYLSRPDKTADLPLGRPATGSIDRPGARDIWTFATNSAGTFRLSTGAGCTSRVATWQVQRDDGTIVASRGDVCGDLAPVTLDAAGRYRLVISGDGVTTGRYEVLGLVE